MKLGKKTSPQSLVPKQVRSNKKIKWKKIVKWTAILVVFVVIARVLSQRFVSNRVSEAAANTVIQTAKVETRDIQVVLTSSGSIEPLNTYEVSTLVRGEVVAADFEEGDQIKEGDVLYQVTTSDLDSEVETQETVVTRAEKEYNKSITKLEEAQKDYQEALLDYEEAKVEYSDLTLIATATGVVKTLFVEVGDSIQKGGQIAEVYDNSAMLLSVPFNASDVSNALIGETAEIEIVDSFETLTGEVIEINPITEVLSGNRVVTFVTIRVTNPGGLTTQTTATASIGDIYSSSEGVFQVLEETIIKAETSGEIESIRIEEGDRIKTAEVIAVLSSDSFEAQLETYEKSNENAEDSLEKAQETVENTKDSLEDAKTKLQDIIDSKTDYQITAPISGQIIRKDMLVGDTISSNTPLCVIYDLSAVTFQMYVDELDVMSVAVGQEVEIDADAFVGVTLTGVVTNISLESTASGGVTQYPVTVKIEEVGDLLPGMNVTGKIIVKEAKGVLAIPNDALIRGDVVYVADTSVTEATGIVPAGFRQVQVETGLTDGDYLEVISGLTGTEEVYVVRAAASEEMPFMPGNFDFGGMGGNAERPDFGGGGGGNMGNRP